MIALKTTITSVESAMVSALFNTILAIANGLGIEVAIPDDCKEYDVDDNKDLLKALTVVYDLLMSGFVFYRGWTRWFLGIRHSERTGFRIRHIRVLHNIQPFDDPEVFTLELSAKTLNFEGMRVTMTLEEVRNAMYREHIGATRSKQGSFCSAMLLSDKPSKEGYDVHVIKVFDEEVYGSN